MIFFIILLVVAIAATVLFGTLWDNDKLDDSTGEFLVAVFFFFFLAIAGALIGLGITAHTNKTKYQSHLENPTQYTYEQLAEHNEEVTEHRAWQGTIFSFYNGVDLSNVDIDNVSHKVIVGE